MSLSTSPELFINMSRIPDEESAEYDSFFQEELRKITYGLTINGVYIHGWLYWMLNHWHIYFDELDPINNDVIRVFKNPQFRDNEWLVAEHIQKAEEQKKGLLLFGTRRFAKTQIEASWIGRGATIYQGSENVVSSTNEPDIKLLVSAIDKGLSAMHPYFKYARLLDDPKKEISLGFKGKKGERYEWSKILIRNLDEGRNTEAIAGTTPKTLVIDEIAKQEKIIEAFVAAMPGFTSPFGWRCMPILSGTGGTFIPNSDAQKILENPDAYNFLAVEWPGKIKKYGLFVAGTYRMEGKVRSQFGPFIQKRSGVLIPEDSELNKLDFYESDPEKAREVTRKELKQAESAQDPKAALKMRMYFPEEPEDCFLSDIENKFPIEAIRQHLSYLEQTEGGRPIELYRDVNGKVRFTYNTKKKEITDFPATKDTIKDAPVMIYEEPCSESPPWLLYIAGMDPYNQNTSANSPSLGTIHIYKRLYNVVEGTFQNMIVASFAARPDRMKDWHKTVEMLMDLYNASCMMENEGTNFREYMENKTKDYMLADGYSLLQSISPHTSIKGRNKGLPATIQVINHCMNHLYDYVNEELTGEDNVGNKITKLGVTRIKDKMLLIEMLNYHPDTNCDRIVSFRHALAYNAYLEKINPVVKMPDSEEQKPTKIVHSPFIKGQSPFGGKRRMFI